MVVLKDELKNRHNRPTRNQRPNNRPYLRVFRTDLRKHLTPAEAKLWGVLKGSKVEGRKFRRQHSVGNYVLDFYCPEEHLAIELDGEVHRSEHAAWHDHDRKVYLNSLGIRVIRFENFLIFDELEYVVERIKSFFGWWEKEDLPPRG